MKTTHFDFSRYFRQCYPIGFSSYSNTIFRNIEARKTSLSNALLFRLRVNEQHVVTERITIECIKVTNHGKQIVLAPILNKQELTFGSICEIRWHSHWWCKINPNKPVSKCSLYLKFYKVMSSGLATGCRFMIGLNCVFSFGAPTVSKNRKRHNETMNIFFCQYKEMPLYTWHDCVNYVN